MIVSPRFFGSDVLESLLVGGRMFNGSGDPPEDVALVQQALADLGFAVEVNGDFDSETEDAVTAYKTGKGITPNDPVVGSQTMGALDDDFAHELFDARANDVAGTRFDLGDRLGTRVEIEDGFATCDFQNGICVEVGHEVAYAMPAAVQAAWLDAGGLDGVFGAPTGNPMELDDIQSAQEFTFAVQIFGGPLDFSLPLDVWQASIAGGGMIGPPLGPPVAVGDGGASFAPHGLGVVLAVPEVSPQPLPQAAFDLWSAQEAAGASLGPPTAFGFPGAGGTTFPFQFGSIVLSEDGTVTTDGPVGADLQRFFQPGDVTQGLVPRLAGTFATPIIGGTAAFAAMRADIARTSGVSDFVYILSWHCNLEMELVPGEKFGALLAARAADQVQIRALLWAGDPVPGLGARGLLTPGFGIPWKLAKDYARTKTSRVVNKPAVDFLNALRASGSDAAGVLDDRHLIAGSHHQKVVIVRAGGKLSAYIGGIEANLDRVPPPVADEPGSPLFDISVRLEDAGAFLLLQTFIARWDLHPDKLGLPLRGASLALPLPAGGPLAVQVTHTYGRGFPFIAAVQTASTALANGIKNARQFFYMEDQYYVGSPKMRAAMREAFAAQNDLVGIVVIAAEPSVGDLPDLPFRRRNFMAPIAASFPGRLLVFERLGGGSPIGPEAYVHTKLLIVDDEAAFVGSVNSNRRSWFHDSEVDATIVDVGGRGGAAPGTRGWVRDFRCNLWSKHLGIDPALLGDFTTCLTLWRAVINSQLVILGGQLVDISSVISVRPYNVNAVVPRYSIAGVPVAPESLELAWNAFEDPT